MPGPRRTAALVAVLLLDLTLVAVPAAAVQAAPFTVTGVVTETDGTPVPGIHVLPVDGAYFEDTTTASDGSFVVSGEEWDDVAAGSVTIGLSDFDYGAFTEPTVVDGIHYAALVTVPVAAGATARADMVVSPRVTGQRAPRTIDPTKRSAVVAAYRAMARDRTVRRHRYPRTGCKTGGNPQRVQRATIRVVNHYRSMAGLEPVALNADYSAKAQAAAVIMARNRVLTHYPTRGMRCWSREGLEGASHSNLYLGVDAGWAITGYMYDPGSNNVPVGHRQWILHAGQVEMGTGDFGGANALYVVGDFDEGQVAAPALSPWPVAGWSPRREEPRGRWSILANRNDIGLGRATITVRSGGKVVASRVVHKEGDRLTWQLRGRAPARASVTVRGATLRGVEMAPYVYEVRLFGS